MRRKARGAGRGRRGALAAALWLTRAAAGAAQRPAGDDRHAARRPAGLLRLRGGRDAGPGRPRRARRALRDRDRPRAAHGAVARLDPHRPAARSATACGTTAPSCCPPPARRWPRPSARAGYRTAAFVSGFPLDHRFGFARGFETYDDQLPRGQRSRRAAYVERTADGRRPRPALDWIRARPRALVRLGALLRPARSLRAAGRSRRALRGEPLRRRDRLRRSRARAAAGSRRGGRRPKPLVLVTSDHGESLGEHGEATHGVFVYDATLRVPWIMAGPGVPRGRVSQRRRPRHRRRPHASRLRGARRPAAACRAARCGPRPEGREMPDAPAYAESLFCSLNLGWAELHALADRALQARSRRRGPSSTTSASDPGESRDVSAAHADDGERAARRRCRRALAGPPARRRRTTPAKRPASACAPSATSAATAPARPTGATRRTGSRSSTRLERGLAEARARPAVAIEELYGVPGRGARRRRSRAATARSPTSSRGATPTPSPTSARSRPRGPLSLEDLDRARPSRCASPGRRDEALAALERAAAADPEAPEPALLRARTLRAMGRGAEAQAALAAGARARPGERRGPARAGGAGARARGDRRGGGAPARRASAPTRRTCRRWSSSASRGCAPAASPRRSPSSSARWPSSPSNPEALLDLGRRPRQERPLARPRSPTSRRRSRSAGARRWRSTAWAVARLESGDAAGAARALRESLALDPRQARDRRGLLRQVAGGKK